MPNKNVFKEFIENLPHHLLNNLENDLDVKSVNKALAYWFKKYYPKGFKIDPNRRNLAIAMVKKKAEMFNVIMTSEFRPYIEALLDYEWWQIWKKERVRESARAKKSNKKIDDYIIFRRAIQKTMKIVFVLGQCLKLEEKKRSPKKKGLS